MFFLIVFHSSNYAYESPLSQTSKYVCHTSILTSGTHAGRCVGRVFRFILVRIIRVVVVCVFIVLFAFPLNFFHFCPLVLEPHLHHSHAQTRVFCECLSHLRPNSWRFIISARLVTNVMITRLWAGLRS